MHSIGYVVEEVPYEFCVPNSDEIQEMLYQFAMQLESDTTDGGEDNIHHGGKWE